MGMGHKYAKMGMGMGRVHVTMGMGTATFSCVRTNIRILHVTWPGTFVYFDYKQKWTAECLHFEHLSSFDYSVINVIH